MAVIKRGILGGFSGSVGNIVGSSWKGIATMKAKPLSVANPQTAGQTAQRTKFAGIVALASQFLVSIVKPLWDRFAQGESGYNAFVKENIDTFVGTVFTNFNDFIEQQLQNYTDLEDVKVTLSEEEFDKLDTHVDETLLSDSISCNICLEELKKDESLVRLNCTHIYHQDCIKEWLTKQSTKCPNCRFCCRDGLKTE